MFKKLNILDEKDSRLRKISKDAAFPLSKEYKDIIKQIRTELRYSQIEEYEKKYNLRPGMGLAFPQLGINERIIVIVYEYDNGKTTSVLIFLSLLSFSSKISIFLNIIITNVTILTKKI